MEVLAAVALELELVALDWQTFEVADNLVAYRPCSADKMVLHPGNSQVVRKTAVVARMVVDMVDREQTVPHARSERTTGHSGSILFDSDLPFLPIEK